MKGCRINKELKDKLIKLANLFDVSRARYVRNIIYDYIHRQDINDECRRHMPIDVERLQEDDPAKIYYELEKRLYADAMREAKDLGISYAKLIDMVVIMYATGIVDFGGDKKVYDRWMESTF